MDNTKPAEPIQFGIASIFWTMFVIGLAIAYLQRAGSTDLVLGGLASVVIGAVTGLIVGSLARKTLNAIVWATLVAAFGYICVASDQIFSAQMRLVWAVIGAFSGAVAGSWFQKSLLKNSIASALAAAIVMFAYLATQLAISHELVVDIVAAPIVGACVALFIWVLTWLEREKNISRYFTATALMTMIVAGNALSIYLGS